jgi:hypothetical protein
MSLLLVVAEEDDWPHRLPGVHPVTARDYLTQNHPAHAWHDRVVNLCRCEQHQGHGYYVSLLAEARGQRPLPAV